jgi:2-iminobutanoate/2-iminopropanoate deaminase
MKKEIIYSNQAPTPIGPYSQAVRFGNLLFCSGQIALDAETGELVQASIELETIKVMENIEALLKSVGLSWVNVLKTSIFLSDMTLFSAVNSIYDTYFDVNFPARETVAVKQLPRNANVEISITAAFFD